MRVELDGESDRLNLERSDAVGEILQVAGVLLDAVNKTLVVVVDYGSDAGHGVEVAYDIRISRVAVVFDGSVLPLEIAEQDGGKVEIGQCRVADFAMLLGDIGGGVGIPGRDDVEAHGDVGFLNVLAELSPLEGHELGEDGRGLERGFLLDEFNLPVPQVEVLE